MRQYLRIVSIILVCILIVGCGKNNTIVNNPKNNQGQQDTNQKGSNNDKGTIIGKVVDVVINRESVTMLDESGKLYTIGKSLLTGNVTDNHIKLIMDDVKYINNFSDGITSSIYLIDKENNLYNYGISYNGYNHYKTKIYENVTDVFGLGYNNVLVTTNGDFYVFDYSDDSRIGSLIEKKTAFTKLASNAKKSFTTLFNYCGYIDNNNDLYITSDGIIFDLLLNNVKDIKEWADAIIILDNNGNALTLSDTKTLTKVDQNVKSIGNGYYITNDGVLKTFIDGNYELNDIKTLYYVIRNTGQDDQYRLVYLNNSNKIVLKNINNKKELDLKVNNMGTILNFVENGSMDDIQTTVDDTLSDNKTTNQTDSNQFDNYTYDNTATIMQIEDVFTIDGVVSVSGIIKYGVIHVGDEIFVKGLNKNIKTKVIKIEQFRKEIDSVSAGNSATVYISDVSREDVKPGQVLTSSDSIKSFKKFVATITMNENISSPINNNDSISISFWGGNIDGKIILNNKQKISAGESATVTIEMTSDVAIEIGSSFKIISSSSFGVIIAHGNVTKIFAN